MPVSEILIFNAPLVVAVLGSLVSVYTDVKWGKIKNVVTIPIIFFGLAWSFVTGGWQMFIENTIVSLIIAVLACAAKQMGEGDIKLIIGIAACLKPFLGLLFLAFYSVCAAISAIYIRLKIYNFDLKTALFAMKTEAVMELGGERSAPMAVHGNKVKHIGAPAIFAALVLCLLRAKMEGFI